MPRFSIQYLHQYLPLPVYEVPAIRVNTTKSTYTFTSVLIVHFIHISIPATLLSLPNEEGSLIVFAPFLRIIIIILSSHWTDFF